MEGLGGDEAALEQYTRLVDLWERALIINFGRYEKKGELPVGVADELAPQIIYTILMAFQDGLIGRHGFGSATASQRKEALTAFLGPSLERLLRGIKN